MHLRLQVVPRFPAVRSGAHTPCPYHVLPLLLEIHWQRYEREEGSSCFLEKETGKERSVLDVMLKWLMSLPQGTGDHICFIRTAKLQME